MEKLKGKCIEIRNLLLKSQNGKIWAETFNDLVLIENEDDKKLREVRKELFELSIPN